MTAEIIQLHLFAAKPGDVQCRYGDCPNRADHGKGKPEIDLCSFHLIRARNEYEALVLGERVCLDHEYRFPAGEGCPVCGRGL